MEIFFGTPLTMALGLGHGDSLISRAFLGVVAGERLDFGGSGLWGWMVVWRIFRAGNLRGALKTSLFMD